jgi:molybdate transport system substrate-binding protein
MMNRNSYLGLKIVVQFLACICAVLSGCTRESPPAAITQPVKPRAVNVAAAADLKFALDEILARFGKTHPDVSVKVTYGSSGNFFSQLSNRAPFDIFLSADLAYSHKLVEQGLASKDDEFQYAIGRIVVWVPKESKLDVNTLGIQALVDPAVTRIAIANPEHAPYGRAAEAAMKKFGVYERAKEHFVLGENVAQAIQFVQTGSADIGVVALSLAIAPNIQDQGRYWEVPVESYPRMDQGGVILSAAHDVQAAKELRDFVVGPEGKAVLKQFGFFMPGE